MDYSLNRIVNKERESEAKSKADDSYDIETFRILICVVAFDLIGALQVDLLLSDKEEVNEKKSSERRITHAPIVRKLPKYSVIFPHTQSRAT